MALFAHRFSGRTTGGELWLISWWANSSSPLATMQSAAEDWADAFWNGDGTTTGYAQEVTTGVTLDQVQTSRVEQATGRQLEKAVQGVTYAGRQTGVEMPADVAIVLSERTNNASRSGRGRFYLPQPAATTVRAGGVIATGSVDNIVDSAGTAWAGYTSTATPVVYSRTQRDTYNITSYDVSNHYDTQRGRDNLDSQSRTSAPMP